MKGYVYILKCANGSYYTGSTTDIERRLWEHQNGEGSNYTKAHLPVELVYVDEFPRIDDAYYREKQIQGWSRKKKEALIADNYEALHKFAECRNSTACFKNNGASTTLSNREDTTDRLQKQAHLTQPVIERSRNER